MLRGIDILRNQSKYKTVIDHYRFVYKFTTRFISTVLLSKFNQLNWKQINNIYYYSLYYMGAEVKYFTETISRFPSSFMFA